MVVGSEVGSQWAVRVVLGLVVPLDATDPDPDPDPTPPPRPNPTTQTQTQTQTHRFVWCSGWWCHWTPQTRAPRTAPASGWCGRC